jgi:hypothetical protein
MHDAAAFAIVAAATSTAALGLGVAWFRTSRRLHQLEDRLLDPSARDEDSERLEQMVQTLAARVEQLSSAQGFLGRLVQNRLERSGGGRQRLEAPKETTPI